MNGIILLKPFIKTWDLGLLKIILSIELTVKKVIQKKTVDGPQNQSKLLTLRKEKLALANSKELFLINQKNKWETNIQFNYKRHYIGNYENEIEAAKAYDKKALELFGENANLNFKKD
jgi:hypothetical protein